MVAGVQEVEDNGDGDVVKRPGSRGWMERMMMMWHY